MTDASGRGSLGHETLRQNLALSDMADRGCDAVPCRSAPTTLLLPRLSQRREPPARHSGSVKELFVSIGVDCDPDRASGFERPTWRGVEQLPRLFELEDVRWTLNVRADTQIRDCCGSAAYCAETFRPVWEAALARGSAIAWHLHYFDRLGRQDTSESNILENIDVGSEALGRPEVVHMGWTFQSDFSVRHLHEAGVRIDYSPLPRMVSKGRGNGVDRYDWSRFCDYRPATWHGVRMIPAYTFGHRVLAHRFHTERVMLTTATAPFLYRSLLKAFFRTGADFFVSYFHADELVSGVGGWRDRLYTWRNLRANLRQLRDMAARQGRQVAFVTIPELARVLFDREAQTLPAGSHP